MILWTFQSSFDRILLRMIRAEASAQEAMNAFDIGLHPGGVAADDDPSDAPTGSEVVLRQSAEGDDREIRRDCRERDVLLIVKDEFVIDLISEHHQIIPTSEFGKLLQHPAGAHGAGGIV